MKTFYMIFAGGVFGLFCLLQAKGVALDLNQTAPRPNIYSSRSSGSSGSSHSGGFFFSSK